VRPLRPMPTARDPGAELWAAVADRAPLLAEFANDSACNRLVSDNAERPTCHGDPARFRQAEDQPGFDRTIRGKYKQHPLAPADNDGRMSMR
jgi:hypothetical protein